ncbi:hypothetical protein CC85DRAFT_290115 [Cutaneotrichosporon oleaginosum]|uniref:Fork-head domain-containing protein n=1 Tax=Cutaneotrichosporon oleaginosum TaxID=879819 RepID=A0A0J0XYC8_9TREE|nr:uncharacterized protein CC85DRAFT_290115 [Cutaneotrichosporon oleaginosum]KLT46046.1 hypothetical protein CC85DRAFT_290115 [Cutaneotrichosporon oleaginosum]TXT06739.1 hypothetical protein COLE_06070 [Cutaneotrichosporon oleaginosum]
MSGPGPGPSPSAAKAWFPPPPSLAALPVDRSKTEPKPAYYKLQFGDESTGFSYYVRTLSVVIGRNVERPHASPAPPLSSFGLDGPFPGVPGLEWHGSLITPPTPALDAAALAMDPDALAVAQLELREGEGQATDDQRRAEEDRLRECPAEDKPRASPRGEDERESPAMKEERGESPANDKQVKVEADEAIDVDVDVADQPARPSNSLTPPPASSPALPAASSSSVVPVPTSPAAAAPAAAAAASPAPVTSASPALTTGPASSEQPAKSTSPPATAPVAATPTPPPPSGTTPAADSTPAPIPISAPASESATPAPASAHPVPTESTPMLVDSASETPAPVADAPSASATPAPLAPTSIPADPSLGLDIPHGLLDTDIFDIKPDLSGLVGFDSNDLPPPPPATRAVLFEHVDVDLGPLKSVSRNHAKIEYRSDIGQFCLEIIGRNGAWVDDRYFVKGAVVPLSQGSTIQIATRIFSFVLPPSPESSPPAQAVSEALEGAYPYEQLPYPYNLPPEEVGYAEFYGEPGPGPATAAALAARIPTFNAFTANDGYGANDSGRFADREWIDEWESDQSENDENSESSEEEEDEDDEDDFVRPVPKIRLRTRRIVIPEDDEEEEEESSLSELSSEPEPEPEPEPALPTPKKKKKKDAVKAEPASPPQSQQQAGKAPKKGSKGVKAPSIVLKPPMKKGKSVKDEPMDVDSPTPEPVQTTPKKKKKDKAVKESKKKAVADKAEDKVAAPTPAPKPAPPASAPAQPPPPARTGLALPTVKAEAKPAVPVQPAAPTLAAAMAQQPATLAAVAPPPAQPATLAAAQAQASIPPGQPGAPAQAPAAPGVRPPQPGMVRPPAPGVRPPPHGLALPNVRPPQPGVPGQPGQPMQARPGMPVRPGMPGPIPGQHPGMVRPPGTHPPGTLPPGVRPPPGMVVRPGMHAAPGVRPPMRPPPPRTQQVNAPADPPKPYYISELKDNPTRPGHILCSVPIPPSGAGPRNPPTIIRGLDGLPFIGPPPLKPTMTFAAIIYSALVNLPRGRGTLGEVCNWVAGEWEYFRLNPEAGWQNSIRHNLSLNKAFLKVPRIPEDDPESKGSVWILDPQEGPLFEEKQRRDALKSEGKAKNAEEKRLRERLKAEERARKQREREIAAAQQVQAARVQPGVVRPRPALSAHRALGKTRLPVIIRPLDAATRAKSIIDKVDSNGVPLPFACDGTQLILDQATFGHLAADITDKLYQLGVSAAVDVLANWVINKQKANAGKQAVRPPATGTAVPLQRRQALCALLS